MAPVTHEISIVLDNPDGGMHFLGDTGDGVTVHIDSDAAVGGQGLGARPQKLLLTSLAACTGMDVLSIMRKKRQNITDFEVKVKGVKAEEHPKVYTHIEVTYIFTGKDIDPAACERSIDLSINRYCPVAGMLKQVAQLDTDFEIIKA